MSTVTPFRLKDVTGALRARRYRQRKKGNETKASVTVDAPGVTAISTAEMIAIACRLEVDSATLEDRQYAGRIINRLIHCLPPDAIVDIP